MTYDFKPATRQDSKVLIGLYGESGCGKTYSALVLGRGIAGENGKVAMIDTESGRGALYADVIPGGYLHSELNEPFSPQRYIDAITAAEKAGFDVLIIDSMSHEWEGIGGVTDMAGDISRSVAKKNAEKWGKPFDWDGTIQFGHWKEPKVEHKKLMLKLLQTRMNIIVCLRAQYKSRQVKNDKGKSEVIKDEFTTPIQSEHFIYEMTAHMEIKGDHAIRMTKCSHPDFKTCFENGKPITLETGRRIATWASGKKAEPPPPLTGDEFLALQSAIKDSRIIDDLKEVGLKVSAAGPRMTESQKTTLNKNYKDRHAELKGEANA